MEMLVSIRKYATEAAKTACVVAGLIGIVVGLCTVPAVCPYIGYLLESLISYGGPYAFFGFVGGGLAGAAYGAVAPLVKSLFASKPKPASEVSPDKGVTVIQSQSLSPDPAQSQSQTPASSNFREKVTQSRNAQTQCVQGA